MIKYYITFLFILYSFLGKTQQYVPLVVDSAHWIIEQCDGSIIDGAAWEYYILGDTVVNSIDYKKVYKRWWQYDFCTLTQPYTNYQLFSLIREDTLNRKVYSTGNNIIWGTSGGYACPSDNDTLIYDFDLQIGDTVNTCVTGLKTITFISQPNFWRSSTTFHTNSGVELYEGVGSMFGLFEYLEFALSGGVDPQLAHYCIGNLANCGLTVSEEEYFTSNVKIYPNPTNGIIKIEFDESRVNNQFYIYNVSGKLMEKKYINSKTSTLNVSHLAEGIYYYKIVSSSNKIFRGKLSIVR